MAGDGGILSVRHLNTHCDFRSEFRDDNAVAASGLYLDEHHDVLVRMSVGVAAATFDYFSRADLIAICGHHFIVVSSRMARTALYDVMKRHVCRAECDGGLFLFRTRRLARRVNTFEEGRSRCGNGSPETNSSPPDHVPSVLPDGAGVNSVSGDDDGYLDISSLGEIRAWIAEWEDVMTSKRLGKRPCAVCAGLVFPCDIRLVSDKKVDFALLRNDELSDFLLPNAYNVTAYDNALLHPAGLVDFVHRSPLWMCKKCEYQLVERRRMPKFALANWLYYAWDRVPPRAKEAFADSSIFERNLVSRCRASRITFRFCAKVGESAAGMDPRVSQGFVKGNVIVTPQDSTRLNVSLPPSPDVVRDSFCALFVGRHVPTKDNIAKMGPILVRKRRVKDMIQFLVENNPAYRVDSEFHGFSQTNLDCLFQSSEGEPAVPCEMEVEHLPDVVAASGVTADTAPRNVEGDRSRLWDAETLLMENVGYTDGDTSPVNYSAMRLAAVQRCLGGNQYVTSRAGSGAVPDFHNPRLLTWLFPQLDPWGIGGFHESRRKVPLTLVEQLSHLLTIDGSPFESDPQFAFVFYNIVRKVAVSRDMTFKVSEARHRRIISDILSMPPLTIATLQKKFEDNPSYRPAADDEKRIVKVLGNVNMIGSDLPGTTAYKLRLRNQIRGMINHSGPPTIFLTVSPADVDHPLVRLYSGEDISIEDDMRGEDLDSWRRKLNVAKHPAAAAQFFDTMICNLIRCVLRFGRRGKGHFGRCSAYYGTVEAQGKGTLHCHMLVWLAGHLSPQRLRDRLAVDGRFSARMFAWLESIIKCELPGTAEAVVEHGPPLTRPALFPGEVHPGTFLPQMTALTDDEFSEAFPTYVKSLVERYNWHEHNPTCWKYNGPGEPRDDAHCRMRIDGSTRACTCIDEESMSIMLRRLHPRINNYNELVIFLMRCNMDVKFIGSGEAAKALVYYITDYITKASLPVHVGLAAVAYAIAKTNERYDGDVDVSCGRRSKTAVTKVVNAMLARQEISHQQVMSYLVGGGDYYASHTFSVLYWAGFDRMVRTHFQEHGGGEADDDPSTSGYDVRPVGDGLRSDDTHADEDGTSDDGTEASDERREAQVALHIGPDRTISVSSQEQDWLYRSRGDFFDTCCLYEFVMWGTKITKKGESTRAARRKHSEGARGKRAELRGEFTSEHPQCDTHLMRKRASAHVPVILGPTVPRRGDEARPDEAWCRAMIILFKPWRTVGELKPRGDDWTSAFEAHAFPEWAVQVMANMNVLRECKDARDRFTNERRVLQVSRVGLDPGVRDVEGFEADIIGDPTLDEMTDTDAPGSGIYDDAVTDEPAGPDLVRLLRVIRSQDVEMYEGEDVELLGIAEPLLEGDRSSLKALEKKMDVLKSNRRPRPVCTQTGERAAKRPRLALDPVMFAGTLDVKQLVDDETSVRRKSSWTVADAVVDRMGMRDNPEQLRAMQIVSKHIIEGEGQLLMYIGGVGGSGKSHVIKGIVGLFEGLCIEDELLLSAPTGIAAILINGYTIHALTMLPRRKFKINIEQLVGIWKYIRTVIVDEISMVSVELLWHISDRICEAKGMDRSDAPFGGVNVICTGDFGQLKPVGCASLYDGALLATMGGYSAQTIPGQGALFGMYLWRQFTTVVELTKNVRQGGDRAYGSLLQRLRVGAPMMTRPTSTEGDLHVDSYPLTDLEVLQSRRMCNLSNAELAEFVDAPYIVGRRVVRDSINKKMVALHAERAGVIPEIYYSRDRAHGVPLSGIIRRRVWRCPSSKTKDSLGILVMFPGMRVMVTSNIAFGNRVVNGAEGVVYSLKYDEDDESRRYVRVVFVRIQGSGYKHPDYPVDVVPIFPARTTFVYRRCRGQPRFMISRVQVPLVPAYAYTDYKSQGRSLDRAIIDLASASCVQAVYVMLSRVRSLRGLAILRAYFPHKLTGRLSEELRNEFTRIRRLDAETAARVAYGEAR